MGICFLWHSMVQGELLSNRVRWPSFSAVCWRETITFWRLFAGAGRRRSAAVLSPGEIGAKHQTNANVRPEAKRHQRKLQACAIWPTDIREKKVCPSPQ